MIAAILGTILKIIGIVLLSILGLLVFLLLVLLFVPVRYRLSFERKGEEMSVRAKVSYLVFVRLPIVYEDGKLKIKLTIFGKTLFSNDENRKKKKAENTVTAVPQNPGDQGAMENESSVERKAETGTNAKTEHRVEEETENEKKAQGEATIVITSETNPEILVRPGEKGENAAKMQREQYCGEKETESDRKKETEAPEEMPHGIFKLFYKIAKRVRRICEKIREFFEKLAAFYEKIKDTIFHVMEKLRAGKGRVTGLWEKVQLVLAFFRDEENKNGIKYAGKSILQLLKHVLPYKIEGEILFAAGDPYSMGQALSVLGILYPLYAKKIRLTADFAADKFLLEGHGALKGRIRLASILRIAWRLWRKGKLKKILSNGKDLKQKLTASA